MKITSWILISCFTTLACSTYRSQPKPARFIAQASDGNIHIYPQEENSDAIELFNEARDKARAQIRSGKKNITVIVHGGLYFFGSSFNLGVSDTISDGSVTWKASPNEVVRLVGAKHVHFEDLKFTKLPFKSSVLGRIKSSNLAEQGILNIGRMSSQGFRLPDVASSSELFQKGKPLQVSKHPNSGWLHLQSVKNNQQFSVKEDISFNANINDAWFYGYWGIDWADQRIKAKAIDQNDVVTLEAPLPFYTMKEKQRVMLLNTAEYLDNQGEYLIDKEGILHLIPTNTDLNADDEYLLSLTAEPLIKIKGASNISIQGFEIGYTRGSAIDVQDGSNITINGNFVRNTGKEGVHVRDGKSHKVINNRFIDTGNEGIIIGGGNRKSLTSSGHLVQNNELKKFGRIGRTYHAGIELYGVGVKVINNDISDAPHFAIRFNGNEHKIERNHIYDVVRETSDAGALYIGRDWTMRGNVIRQNYIHDLGERGLKGPGEMGVYMDDMGSGANISENYFFNAGRCVFIGGGRDNIIDNNIFVGCKNSFHLDDRGVSWRVDWYGAMGMTEKLNSVDYKNPPFSTTYPSLANVMDNKPLLPLGNEFKRNILIGSPVMNYNNPYLNVQNITVNQIAPLALDTPEEFDLFIRKSVRSYPEGFKPIPADQIGLQENVYRTEILKKFGK